jgi:hypothetical protein
MISSLWVSESSIKNYAFQWLLSLLRVVVKAVIGPPWRRVALKRFFLHESLEQRPRYEKAQ